jgi:3-phenylpropionate/trans-cinnamate dioxygenase ferredoxin subunit
MIGRLMDFLHGPAVRVEGTERLPEGESRTVAIGDPLAGGTEFVLCRLGGKLFAVDVHCPHEDGRIASGPLVGGRYVMCPLHKYKFDPRNGAPVGAVCGKAKTYRVREGRVDCRVWV